MKLIVSLILLSSFSSMAQTQVEPELKPEACRWLEGKVVNGLGEVCRYDEDRSVQDGGPFPDNLCRPKTMAPDEMEFLNNKGEECPHPANVAIMNAHHAQFERPDAAISNQDRSIIKKDSLSIKPSKSKPSSSSKQ